MTTRGTCKIGGTSFEKNVVFDVFYKKSWQSEVMIYRGLGLAQLIR